MEYIKINTLQRAPSPNAADAPSTQHAERRRWIKWNIVLISDLWCVHSSTPMVTTIPSIPRFASLQADLDQTCAAMTPRIFSSSHSTSQLTITFRLLLSLCLTSGEPGPPAIQRLLLGRRPQHLLLMGFLAAIFLLPIVSQVVLPTTQRIIISIQISPDREHSNADGDYFPPLNPTLVFACPRKWQ
jgi:hypothetical protein